MREIEGAGLRWGFSDGILTIEGAGALPDYLGMQPYDVLAGGVGPDDWRGIVPWGNLMDEVTEVRADGLTEVPPTLFAWHRGLRTAHLPSVRFIGNGAFYECRALEVAEIPKVVLIGSGAFERCERLVGTSPKSGKMELRELRFIGRCAFHGCKALKSVSASRAGTSGSELEYVGDYAFAESGMSDAGLKRGGADCRAYFGENVFWNRTISE